MCGEHSSVIPSESYLVLSNEEERLRSIANLQQRAQVLEKELALRENEAPFRLLVEAVQDYAIFILNPEGYRQYLEYRCGTHQGIQSGRDHRQALLLFLSGRRHAKR